MFFHIIIVIIWQEDAFTERFIATIGVDFECAAYGVNDESCVAQKIKTIELEQKKMKLQIVWSQPPSWAFAD